MKRTEEFKKGEAYARKQFSVREDKLLSIIKIWKERYYKLKNHENELY